jgi:hypothetical protein
MMNLNDVRWHELKGGYRTKCDPRPLLTKIEAGEDLEDTWHELWGELYHQGDVGEASYAAVPQIVRIYRHHAAIDWNPYAIVAMIDLARDVGSNPEVPAWLAKEYFAAIEELAEIGRKEIPKAQGSDEVPAILSVIALVKDRRVHAKFLVKYTDDELLDIESRLS